MGLREDIQSDIEEAFNTDLADAVTSFTYRVVASTFNATNNTTSETNTDYISRGVFNRFKREIIKDESILATDTKLIVLQHEIAVMPEKNNQIITASKTYTIIAIKEDPAHATWILQCRE